MFKGRKKICIVRTLFIILMYVQMNNGKVEGKELEKCWNIRIMKLHVYQLVSLGYIFLELQMVREANKH